MVQVRPISVMRKKTVSSGHTRNSRKSTYTSAPREKISERAHELFLKRGAVPGNDWHDWFAAKNQPGRNKPRGGRKGQRPVRHPHDGRKKLRNMAAHPPRSPGTDAGIYAREMSGGQRTGLCLTLRTLS